MIFVFLVGVLLLVLIFGFFLFFIIGSLLFLVSFVLIFF